MKAAGIGAGLNLQHLECFIEIGTAEIARRMEDQRNESAHLSKYAPRTNQLSGAESNCVRT